MKKLFVLFFIFISFLVTGLSTITGPILLSEKQVAIPLPDTALLHKYVNVLCGIHPFRQASSSFSLDTAATFIEKTLNGDSILATEQTFEVDGKRYKNIVCSFGPSEAEHVVVGAHYDVCGAQAGADDNASGVAGLLEIARFLKANQPVLRQRVDLVFYTLEEPPYFRTRNMGSAVHARSLKEKKTPVKCMICLEMIGYFSDKAGSQEYPFGLLGWFYPSAGNYITVVGKTGQGALVRKIKKGMASATTLDIRSINAPAFIPGLDFSDHLNYWAEGYQAVMITNTAFYRNKNYHESGDVPSTLDYHRMAQVVQGVCAAILGLNETDNPEVFNR
jgi:Zn-dependent M28 family amino/carboxypeptidase